MATSKIALISARAKKIRKANPKMKWQDCIKKASAELSGKKSVSGVKRKADAKTSKPAKAVKMKKTVTVKKTVKMSGMSGVGMAGLNTTIRAIDDIDGRINGFKEKIRMSKGREKALAQSNLKRALLMKKALMKQKALYKRVI